MGYPGNKHSSYPGSSGHPYAPPPPPSSGHSNNTNPSQYPLPPPQPFTPNSDPTSYPYPPSQPYTSSSSSFPSPMHPQGPMSMPMSMPMPMASTAPSSSIPSYPDVGPNPPMYQPPPVPFPTPLHTHVNYVDDPSSSIHGSRSSLNAPPSGPPMSSLTTPLNYKIIEVNGVPRIQGRKKALLIGINYKNSQAALRGCIQDVKNMKQFLMQRYGFTDTPQTMVVLTDDQSDPKYQPTRKNMIQAMQWLTSGVSAGDSLFFHFSGHGDQKPDEDGDEEDGFDETILPLDFKSAGVIVDDELHALLVKPLPPGCRLTAVFDSCHSGTALDLPYIYLPNGQMKKRKTKEEQLLAQAGQIGLQFLSGNKMGAMQGIMKLFNPLRSTSKSKNKQLSADKVEQVKRAEGEVVQFSGCKDYQTSADANIEGQFTGAMSWALLKSLESHPQQSYAQVLSSTRSLLVQKYTQIPQLSSGRPIDMNQLFLL